MSIEPSASSRTEVGPLQAVAAGPDQTVAPSRRYENRKLLIKPSEAAVRRIRERLRTEMRSLRGTNAQAVLIRLNPIIRGWSAYYRGVVSSKAFSALDDYVWKPHLQVGDLRAPEQVEALQRWRRMQSAGS
jgi:Group II intron, maturase-specific domain